MRMPRRGQGWIWAGRIAAAVILAWLVVYLVRAGLENADKLGSSISAVLAAAALLAPYLLPAREPSSRGIPSPGLDQSAATPTLGSEIDLRKAKGVQVIGDGATGTQTNTFTES